MKTYKPFPNRVTGINRDTYQPQRIAYPIIPPPRRPVSFFLVRDLLYFGSAAIVVGGSILIYHILTN